MLALMTIRSTAYHAHNSELLSQKLQIPIKRFEHTHSINKIDLVARRLTFSTIYCNGTISWLIHYGQSLSR